MRYQLRQLDSTVTVAIAVLERIEYRPGEDAVSLVALECRLARRIRALSQRQRALYHRVLLRKGDLLDDILKCLVEDEMLGRLRPAETTRSPSGEKATEMTDQGCPTRVRSRRPLCASHSLIVLSPLPEATVAPSCE